MSHSGKYIALYYHSNSPGTDLTIVWQIAERLDFGTRMMTENWAHVVYMDYPEFQNVFSNSSILFLDDDYCLTTSDRIQLASRRRQPFAEELTKKPDVLCKDEMRIYYTEDGNLLYVSQRKSERDVYVRIINPLGGVLLTYGPISGPWNSSNYDISPDGRFLVVTPDRWSRPAESLFLYDLRASRSIELSISGCSYYEHAKFHFADDGQRFIAFIMCQLRGTGMVFVFVWNHLATPPVIKCQGELRIIRHVKPYQIHVNGDEVSALMVTPAPPYHSIQRIDFADDVIFPNAIEPDEEYLCKRFFLSNDGTCLATLSYGRDKGYLHLLGLGTGSTPCRKADLVWSPCLDPDLLTIAMSPDLNLLSVNADIFDLTQLQAGPVTVLGYFRLLFPLDDGQTADEGYFVCRRACRISPCNSYIVYKVLPYVFEINIKSRTSWLLEVELDQPFVPIAAEFHPSQPLVAIWYSFLSEEGEDLNQVDICNLKTGEINSVPLPTRPYIEAFPK